MSNKLTNTKYLIVAGNSFLGSYIIQNILEKTEENIIATYNSGIPFLNNSRITWQQCDVTKYESLLALKDTLGGNKVKGIYLAGYIKPDDVEKNSDLAKKINIDALKLFLNTFKMNLEKFYYASTDMVFDANCSNYKYKENDNTCPMNKYGEQKRICERIVNEAGFNVFRCPLMFGKSLIPERFHFIDHICDSMTKGYIFKVLSDYYESSLDYDTVAKMLLKVIEINNSHSIIHICADEKISKYQIAQEYAKKYNLDSEYIKPIKLKDADFFVAKRGSVLLDNSLIKNLLKINKIERNI